MLGRSGQGSEEYGRVGRVGVGVKVGHPWGSVGWAGRSGMRAG